MINLAENEKGISNDLYQSTTIPDSSNETDVFKLFQNSLNKKTDLKSSKYEDTGINLKPELHIYSKSKDKINNCIPSNHISLVNIYPNSKNSPPSVKLNLDIENVGRKKHSHTLLEDIEPNQHRSWDELDEGSDFVRRDLEYDLRTKELIITAAANATLGFESQFVSWNAREAILELTPAAQNCTFSNYIETFAHTGTLLRRLSLVVADIRSNALNQSPTHLALASTIEKEICAFKNLGEELHHSVGLIDLTRRNYHRSVEIRTLTEYIGCAGTGGHLSRIPSVVEILERIVVKACALGLGRLWCMVYSLLSPWFEQLNFVIGLNDPLIIRKADTKFKQFYFPEVFIGIDTTTDDLSLVLIPDQIPDFISPSLTNPVLDCYKMLCLIGLKGPDAVKRTVSSKHCPLKFGVKDLSSLNFTELAPIHLSGNTKVFESKSWSSKGQLNTEPKPLNQKLREVSCIVLLRSLELSSQVKCEFMEEILNFRLIMFNVYLLQDGALWSQLSDFTTPVLDNWSQKYHESFISMNELLASYYGVGVNMTTTWGNFKVIYEPPYMKQLFGKSLFVQFQAIFNEIIQLHYNHDLTGLALLTSQLEIAIVKVNETINCKTAGILDIKKAFEMFSEMNLPIKSNNN